MKMRPLGDYERLFRSIARAWGAGTVVRGSGVLDDLLAGLDQHATTDWTAQYRRRLQPRAAVIGCVPWLTDHAIAEALASFGQCCVVVDKQQPEYDAVRWLAGDGKSLSSAYLDGFDDIALPDKCGNPPIIHPYSGRPTPSSWVPYVWPVGGGRRTARQGRCPTPRCWFSV